MTESSVSAEVSLDLGGGESGAEGSSWVGRCSSEDGKRSGLGFVCRSW